MKKFALFALLTLSQTVFAVGTVRVAGEVKNPGDVAIADGMRVRDVIEKAGGLTSNSDPKLVTVSTNDRLVSVDLTKLGPTPLANPGSTIYVAAFDANRYVSVRGAVSSPGFIPYSKGLTLKDAIEQARPIDTACIDCVKVSSTDANGAVVTTTYDLSKVSAESVALNARDKVVVPYNRDISASDRELITIVVIGLLILVLLK